MLQYITSGESHGHYMMAILEGMPSGVQIDDAQLKADLALRQQGYGRGGRQKIETDRVALTGGVYKGVTTGGPIGFLLENADFKINEMPQLHRPRPGHTDLAGALKYNNGIRETLERASARETVMRVAVGSVCKMFLKACGIETAAHVVRIGSVELTDEVLFDEISGKTKDSDMRCVCGTKTKEMIEEVNKAMKAKDTVGGQFEVRLKGIPIGLGSHVHYKRKLDGRIAQALMSMQSIKAVEIGIGTKAGEISGSEAHDEIFYDKDKGYYHKTNRAGGFTGGITNGNEISVRATMKPIATLRSQLSSVNMQTKKEEKADFERSDVCAVPAGSLIGQAIVACEVADAMIEKFGGDSLEEHQRNLKGYLNQLANS